MVSEDHFSREAGHHDKPDVDRSVQVDSQAENALAHDVQGRIVGTYQMSLNVAEGLYQDTRMIRDLRCKLPRVVLHSHR